MLRWNSSTMKFWFHLALHLTVAFSDFIVLGNTLCAFSKKENVKYNKRGDSAPEEDIRHHSMQGHSVDSNNTEHCSKDTDSCYVLWYEDPLNKSVIILTQGCWDSSGDSSCIPNECIADKKPFKPLNNSKFCCCSGNLCNINVTDLFVSTTMDQNTDLNPASPYVEPLSYSLPTIAVIAIAAVIIFIIVSLVMYYIFKHYFNPIKRSKESLHLMESASSSAPMLDFGNLKIQETIGKGRYGTVCRGTLQDHVVAVKIFCFQNKQYFLNERDIYTLPHMEHPSLLKFIGSEERLGQDGRPEFHLILSFAPDGCLQDYLRKFTVNFSGFCKMTLSIARGLAHLHTEIGKGDKIKPCVAHRDLNSRNILIKPDGTCMLCDFGFALRISGSKYFSNGEEQIAETTSLADVGTALYMAPEILEGAVNLRDCESSLKQIDVYALGLVLWEIATRCTDLYQGVGVSDYKLPFEAEVGIHPTMEQMQLLVTRNKTRPLFPKAWTDINPAVRTLKETIEECWDQDAEARLTTLCVEERLAELFFIWERYKDGLSAPSLNSSIDNLASSQKALCKVQSSSDINSEVLNNNRLSSKEKTCSLSEGTTITLSLPSEAGNEITPGESPRNGITNLSASKLSLPLQPQHGHNSSLHHNLMFETDCEATVGGNQLVEMRNKASVDRSYCSFSDGDTAAFNTSTLDSSSLVSNDLLSHSIQIFNPIPHLNNVVVPTALKTPNISDKDNKVLKNTARTKGHKRWLAFKLFDHKRNAKEGIGAGLRSLLEKRPSSASKKHFPEEQQPLKGAIGNCQSPTPTSKEKYSQNNNFSYISTADEIASNDHLIQTEVRVIKPDLSSTVVRPVNNMHASLKDESIEIPEKVPNGITKVVEENICPESIVSVNTSNVKMLEKMKRPKSLPLQEFEPYTDGGEENVDAEISFEKSESEFSVPMRRKNSSIKKKGVKRVKTPFEIKGRFSLYDDRIMSSQELSMAYSKEPVQNSVLGDNTKFSTSVPLGMNVLCSTHSSNTMCSDESQCKSSEVQLKNGMRMPANLNQLKVVSSLCDI